MITVSVNTLTKVAIVSHPPNRSLIEADTLRGLPPLID
jgi:hypothetical protein